MEYVHTELAWAAGFFDGEGWIGFPGKGSLRLSVGQVDRFVLDRFQAAVQTGHVDGPWKSPSFHPTWQPKFGYRAYGHEAQQVIACLWSWLSPVKREQAAAAMRAWADAKLMAWQVCAANGHRITTHHTNRQGLVRVCLDCQAANKREERRLALV